MARCLTLTWLAAFCCALAVSSGANPFETPDYAVASEFIESGNLSLAQPIPGSPYRQGPNGRYYNVHELVPTLAGVPLAWAARQVPAPSIPVWQRFKALLMLSAAACFATTIVLLAVVGMMLRVPYRYTVVWLGVLTLASQYLVYAGAFPDVSMATPVLAGCVALWLSAERGVRGAWAAVGLVAGLAAAVKLNTGTLIPVLLLLAITSPGTKTLRTRIGCAATLILGLIPGVLLITAWNYVRTGDWLTTPYPTSNVTFSAQWLASGLVGTLASPGKGLLVFTPVLLLVPLIFGARGGARVHPRLTLLVFGSLGLAMLTLASTEAWASGGGWGIRFYVPWLPVLLLFVACEIWRRRADRATRAVFAGLVVLGVVVNLAGVIANFHYRQQLCGMNPWTLRGAHTCAVAAAPVNIGRTIGFAIPDVVVDGASSANVFASNRVALWWYTIQAAGVPALVSWSIPCLLLGGAFVFWRRAGSPPDLTA